MAPARAAVRARPGAVRSAARGPAVLGTGAVHVTEGRCGEGREDERVVRDGRGDGLAAEEACADHLERVARVDAGACGADGLAPVAARPVQDAERRVVGAELRQHLTRGLVDGGR